MVEKYHVRLNENDDLKLNKKSQILRALRQIPPKKYISRRSAINIHIIASTSNQGSTSFAHQLIVFLKQQITADITTSYVNPPCMTDRCALEKKIV